MNVKIDFLLSRRFNTVEQTIFHLVLGKVEDVSSIRVLLSVYSDEVIANAIKRLVNYQILNANIETRMLNISEPVLAVIEECLEHSQSLRLPDETVLDTWNGKVLISDEDTKRKILNTLLPDVKVGFLAKSIDFVVYERCEE